MMTKLFPLVSCYYFLSQVKHLRKNTENINKSYNVYIYETGYVKINCLKSHTNPSLILLKWSHKQMSKFCTQLKCKNNYINNIMVKACMQTKYELWSWSVIRHNIRLKVKTYQQSLISQVLFCTAPLRVIWLSESHMKGHTSHDTTSFSKLTPSESKITTFMRYTQFVL